MALLNISAAARATGKDRTTIHRKLKSGELSATAGPDGSKLIDTAELVRVFGALRATGEAPPVSHRQDTTDTAPALVELLRGQLAQAASREQWLRDQLETEQQARRELEARLLPPPDHAEVSGISHTRNWWWLVLVPIVAAMVGYLSQRLIW